MKHSLAFTVLAVLTSQANAGTMKGPLAFSLQSAGPAIVVAQLPSLAAYEELEKALASKKPDGPTVLVALRRMNVGAVEAQVSTTVQKAIDPDNKYPDFMTLAGAEEMSWASPLIQYAAGDNSDDEPIYVTVNRELRDSKPDSKKTTDWVTSMRQAMSRLPKYEGLSFRGTRLMDARIDAYYAVGKPTLDPAFYSTSIDPLVSFRFAVPGVYEFKDKNDRKKTAVVLVVRGKNGRPVSQFAWEHQHEQEILFANGTTFTVIGKSAPFIDAELKKTVVVVLQEN